MEAQQATYEKKVQQEQQKQYTSSHSDKWKNNVRPSSFRSLVLRLNKDVYMFIASHENQNSEA